MSRATDRDFEAFGSQFKAFLSVALSNTLKHTIGDLDREIAETIKKTFWYPGNPSKLAVRSFTIKGAKFSSAGLSYKFEAVSLSKYPMKQVRITVGNNRIRVSRGGGFSAGNKFTTSQTPQTATMTQFKLRKSDGWRTVQGRTGFKYKGFLHTGRKGKGAFSSAVFERQQKATWSGSQRLPIHKLYGASLVHLLHSHEIQALLKETKVFDKFQKDFYKSLSVRL
jgi:hypothetical protein